jgi:hypothetical protein
VRQPGQAKRAGGRPGTHAGIPVQFPKKQEAADKPRDGRGSFEHLVTSPARWGKGSPHRAVIFWQWLAFSVKELSETCVLDPAVAQLGLSQLAAVRQLRGLTWQLVRLEGAPDEQRGLRVQPQGLRHNQPDVTAQDRQRSSGTNCGPWLAAECTVNAEKKRHDDQCKR